MPRHQAESIVLGGGCFWCTEAIFSSLRGVISVRPGYAGGAVPYPNYEAVCTGNTGHAEVVEVVFNPAVLPLDVLLEVFMATHDPMQLNRQGVDVGSQYRSIILYSNQEQRATAEAVKRQEEEWRGERVLTEIAPLQAFYPAEISHQRYYELNPHAPYCQVVIGPKLRQLNQKYPQLTK